MITPHQFGPELGLPSPSPFCMKLERFLGMAGLPYRSAPADLATEPNGKAPWIEDDGARVGDSALAIRYLERKHGLALERGLSPVERAAAHGFGVMLEERNYFAMVHDRWLDDASWPIVRDAFLGGLPPPMQDQIRRKQREKMVAQGLGAHTPEEMHELALADMDALAGWLATSRSSWGRRRPRSTPRCTPSCATSLRSRSRLRSRTQPGATRNCSPTTGACWSDSSTGARSRLELRRRLAGAGDLGHGPGLVVPSPWRPA
jgi:glutathione S-transferase